MPKDKPAANLRQSVSRAMANTRQRLNQAPPLAVVPQYLMPKRAMTVIGRYVASWQGGRWSTMIIRNFIRYYDVDMTQAIRQDPASYVSFNDFFTRALLPGQRPIAQTSHVSPVDGAISQFGAIKHDQVFQAKGHHYSTTALLGGDATLAEAFHNGTFATIYLSPRDYHRVHMPCEGKLERMIYVPGDLFSVSPTTVAGVPGLFARNERVVCIFSSPQGFFALVLVGAAIVGSIATTWHGTVNEVRDGKPVQWDYADTPVTLRKGEEMGRFLLGSTVVMLFAPGSCAFPAHWAPGGVVRQGEAMSDVISET